jgi:hypothetical protein
MITNQQIAEAKEQWRKDVMNGIMELDITNRPVKTNGVFSRECLKETFKQLDESMFKTPDWK